jgi:hypothetical protein
MEISRCNAKSICHAARPHNDIAAKIALSSGRRGERGGVETLALRILVPVKIQRLARHHVRMNVRNLVIQIRRKRGTREKILLAVQVPNNRAARATITR